jgi:hypothetical protein
MVDVGNDGHVSNVFPTLLVWQRSFLELCLERHESAGKSRLSEVRFNILYMSHKATELSYSGLVLNASYRVSIGSGLPSFNPGLMAENHFSRKPQLVHSSCPDIGFPDQPSPRFRLSSADHLLPVPVCHSRFLEAGGSVEVLQAVLGHSTIRLMEQYGKLLHEAAWKGVRDVYTDMENEVNSTVTAATWTLIPTAVGRLVFCNNYPRGVQEWFNWTVSKSSDK